MDYEKLEKIWCNQGVFDLMTNRYKKQIEEEFNFDVIISEIKKSDYIVNDYEVEEYDEDPIRAIFVGTVFSIMPSGKYYMSWTTNQTAKDVLLDECFTEALNEILDRYGLFAMGGEGDPCDVFFCQ